MRNKLSIAIVLTLLVGTLLAGAVVAQEPVHWSYEGEEGPAHWGELSPDFALCSSGKEQSPVDIPASTPLNESGIAFNYQPTAVNILNNGHTIQVNYDEGSLIEVDGTKYNLLQFHFHGPSEHTVNGQSYDMEMHLVHQNADGGLAVVGVLIKSGSENPAFAPMWDNLPAEEGGPEMVSGASVNASDLLPADRAYYRYNGSLTTPPCSEDVKWFMLSTPAELSEGQIDAFEAIMHDNNRPVQPLNDRSFLLASAMEAPEAMPTAGAGETSLAPALAIVLGIISMSIGGAWYAAYRRWPV